MKTLQQQRANTLRDLHDRDEILLLPNAWDAGSARLFAAQGFPAVATTSGGVAWSLGYADGEQLPLEALLNSVRRMVQVCPVPVTVDFEGGFGETAEAVGESVAALLETGAVGINLEDGVLHQHLRSMQEMCERIAAAREAAERAGIPLFINARVDGWIVGGAEPDALLEQTLQRGQAYLQAGADGIYPIALSDPERIATVCRALDAPINIAARVGLPPLKTLQDLGVARVSMATRLTMLAYGAACQSARQLREQGTFDSLDSTLGYDELQALFQ